MRVLVVGAGAVGQVYGHHLQRGGASVCFYVREKYAAAARAGFVLYPLNEREPTRPRRWRDFSVVTTDEAVAAETWDYVLLTVSSSALHGEWLARLIGAAKAATVVMLQPASDDRAVVAAHVPDDRLVSGMISLVSYAAPLPGETRFPEPGMAYWFPPLGPSPFSGPKTKTSEFVRALRRGGQPAIRIADVPGTVDLPSSLMMPWLVALEAAGWKFSSLFAGDLASLGGDGAREALAIVTKRSGKWAGPLRLGASATMLRSLLWFVARVAPFPLETYLREHFIKVGDQTRLFMQRYVELGRASGQSTKALEVLTQRLATRPAAPQLTGPARPSD